MAQGSSCGAGVATSSHGKIGRGKGRGDGGKEAAEPSAKITGKWLP